MEVDRQGQRAAVRSLARLLLGECAGVVFLRVFRVGRRLFTPRLKRSGHRRKGAIE